MGGPKYINPLATLRSSIQRFNTVGELRKWVADDFRNFVQYANKILGFKTGKIQLEMANALQAGHATVLLTCFRGSSKSYISDLYVLWRLHRAWNTKILILGGTDEIAKKHIRRLVDLIYRLPAIKYITFSKRTETEFQLSQATVEADCSVRTAGIFSAIESSRADLIIIDDAELTSNSFSPTLRAKLLYNISDLHAILHPPHRHASGVPEKTQAVVIGTPKSEYSVYLPSQDDTVPHPLQKAFRVKIPALSENNSSTFPERFSTIQMLDKRTGMTRPKWYLEMMLEPGLLDKQQRVIDYDNLLTWSGEIVDPVMTIDPAGEQGGGDEHAYAIGGLAKSDKTNRVHVKKLTGTKDLKIEAFLELAIKEAKKYKVELILIESNFAGYVTLMRRMVGEQGSFCKVEPVRSSLRKADRLCETLDPLLNGQRVSFEKSVLEEDETKNQFKGWTYLALPERDDRLDALAFLVAYYMTRLEQPDEFKFEVCSMGDVY